MGKKIKEVNTEDTFVLSLDKTSRMQELNDWILARRKKGSTTLHISVRPSRTYSNVCAPIAGMIQYYKKQGISIDVTFPRGDYVRHTKFWDPLPIETAALGETYYPFDKVWTFSTGAGVNALVSAFVLELRKSDLMAKGAIESVEWCLNEVMDNVLQHAGTGEGYVMAQVLKQTKVFAFCVFDAGIGFYNSLKNSKHHPAKAIDAITLALQEKITRDEKIGQGNGLWGLSSIISRSHGGIDIRSGGATYQYYEDSVKTIKGGGFVLNKKQGTSYVDVRLNYGERLDIVSALTDSSGVPYTSVDLWLENLEDNRDQYRISVSEHSGGTGTRQSAEKLRNMILNISENEKKVVILDFAGVNLISSSFADELIGKIIAERGFFYFTKAFKINNMSEFNVNILNRSVGQRMAQTYLENALDLRFDDEK